MRRGIRGKEKRRRDGLKKRRKKEERQGRVKKKCFVVQTNVRWVPSMWHPHARGTVGDGGGRGGGRGREEKGNPNILVQSCGQSHLSL